MRSTTLWIAGLALVAVAACDRGSASDARLSEDLERDLAAAASATLELANGSQGYQPMRFVSEVEQISRSTPAPPPSAPARNVAKPATETVEEPGTPPAETASEPVQEPAPEPVEADAAAAAESPTEVEAPAEADVYADAPRVPVVAPRPAPIPVDVPAPGGAGSGRARGGDDGPDWGTVIGVVIRGGRVGDRHCPPRPRGGGIIVPIPRRHEALPPVLRPIVP